METIKKLFDSNSTMCIDFNPVRYCTYHGISRTTKVGGILYAWENHGSSTIISNVSIGIWLYLYVQRTLDN